MKNQPAEGGTSSACPAGKAALLQALWPQGGSHAALRRICSSACFFCQEKCAARSWSAGNAAFSFFSDAAKNESERPCLRQCQGRCAGFGWLPPDPPLLYAPLFPLRRTEGKEKRA
jgi:hypothetical protein